MEKRLKTLKRDTMITMAMTIRTVMIGDDDEDENENDDDYET